MNKVLGYGEQRLIKEIIEKTYGEDAVLNKQFTINDILYIIQEMKDEEGKKYLSDDNLSRRGHHIFRFFVEHLLYRNLANYDSMVLLTSEKGTGKSSSALMMARFWCQLIGIRFDPKRHIAYSNKDVMDKIDMLNRFEPLVCDESIRFACITGDTIIKTKDGEKTIKEIHDTGYNKKILSYNTNSHCKEYKLFKQCIRKKEKEIVYEIELDNGKKIKATKKHKFLTRDGWKQLHELCDGDDIYAI